jgi:hypothetical protein
VFVLKLKMHDKICGFTGCQRTYEFKLIFIQIHTKYTIMEEAKPNFFLKVAVGAGKNLLRG